MLLAIAFVAFAVLSFTGPHTLLGHELKDGGFAETLAGKAADQAPTAQQIKGAAQQVAQAQTINAQVDSTAKTILFIGDSMLEGLSPRLAAYADRNGHTLYTVMWYSSTSEVWGRSGKLASYIQRLHPDYIFICLGANELFVKDIAKKRDKYVKAMLSEIGSIPYVWIGPPNWKADTGINDLIAANAAPGSFFVSNGMHFDRSSDGAHPTRSSAIQWMDSVARWMPLHAAHPIMMDRPDRSTSRPKRIFVHQPDEK